MSTVHLSVGLTESDRANNYFPMSDGWREGQRERRWTLNNVELPTVDDPELIVEAVFCATNAPQEIVDADPIAKPIRDAMVKRQQEAAGAVSMAVGTVEDYVWTDHLRSVSVGDIVTVYLDDGRFQKTYACDHVGWLPLDNYGRP